MMNKNLVKGITTIVLSVAMAIPVYAGYWEETERGTMYRYDNGTTSDINYISVQPLDDDKEYFFDYHGTLLKNQWTFNGKYAGEDGAIKPGVTRKIDPDARPLHAQYKRVDDNGNEYRISFEYYDEMGLPSDWRDTFGGIGIMAYHFDDRDDVRRYIIHLGDGSFALGWLRETGEPDLEYMSISEDSSTVYIQDGRFPYTYEAPLE